MSRKALLSLTAFLLWVPMLALAAGLVPCGGPGEPVCQMCYLVELLDNIMDWLIAILTVVAAITFVYSGITLVTSGGNVGAMTKAKTMISNTFIGFTLVLCAWLIIDFFLKALIGAAAPNTLGTWHTIQCVDQPTAAIISKGLVGGAIISAECDLNSNNEYDCTDAISRCEAGEGSATVVQAGTAVDCKYEASAYSGSCEQITNAANPCHADNPAMRAAFGDRVQEASVICNKESGGASVRSGSDLCCGPDGDCSGAPSFSGGYFQINVLAHADKIPGCEPGQFYSKNGGNTPQGQCVRRNPEGICTGWSCSITDQAMYNRCMEVTKNSDLNFQIAQQLYEARGNKFNDWSWSAKRCGVRF